MEVVSMKDDRTVKEVIDHLDNAAKLLESLSDAALEEIAEASDLDISEEVEHLEDLAKKLFMLTEA
jgi:hypothetical protein